MALFYDGTLPGFFTALGRHHNRLIDGHSLIKSSTPKSGDLFFTTKVVPTDHSYSTRIVERLSQRMGRESLSTLGLAFLSEETDVEATLLAFIALALKQGPEALQNHADPTVHRVRTLARRTSRERHRLLGLLRFIRLGDGLYLARIAPKSHVVPLLARHFSRRLADQRWLIIDTERRVGVYGQQGDWELATHIELPDPLPLHPEEAGMAQLWCDFYHSIAIPERFNPKLRQQFMPQHSWRYLTEMMGEEKKS